MDKMTNDERREIAKSLEPVLALIPTGNAYRILKDIHSDLTAPEREYPTKGEYQRSGRDLCVKHKNGVGVRLLTFEIGVPAADRRLFEKAYEMYKHEREIVGATDTSSKFVIPNGETTHKIMKSRIDYIETGANNESP